MKVRETREVAGGLGGHHTEARVRTLLPGEELPAGAVEVAEDVEEHDWRPE